MGLSWPGSVARSKSCVLNASAKRPMPVDGMRITGQPLVNPSGSFHCMLASSRVENGLRMWVGISVYWLSGALSPTRPRM